ncbi:MAG TPA: ATP synthase F1 subunit epsilon [Rhodospirillaceae bacterium]|nr:ATP synthase F1 subunit epsilon [Rhodospirillaceae bacterium]
MTGSFQFELTSPQKLAFDKPVAMVTVPSSEGAYSVLVGHAPMVTDVAAGIVEVYENDAQKVSERFFVTGGFCEVTTTSCSLMADDILALDSLDRGSIEAQIEELTTLRDELGNKGEDNAPVEAKLAIEMAKLEAAA